jgi:hypothetical protein
MSNGNDGPAGPANENLYSTEPALQPDAPDEARVAARRDRIRERLRAKFDPVPEQLVDFLAEPTSLGWVDDAVIDGEADMVLNGEVDVDLLLGWKEAARAEAHGEAAKVEEAANAKAAAKPEATEDRQ